MDLFLYLNIEVCGNCCFWLGFVEVDCLNVVLYDMSWNFCCCSWWSIRWLGSRCRVGVLWGCFWFLVFVIVFVLCFLVFVCCKVFCNRLCLLIEKNFN